MKLKKDAKRKKKKRIWFVLSIIHRISEILWNIIGIYIIFLQHNDWKYLLLYIYVGITCILMVFVAQSLKYIFCLLAYFLDNITPDVIRQMIMISCSLATTSFLIYNAYYVTDTSQLYGTNFTYSYSFGFIAFNILAMYIKFRTKFFSFADFFMRAQISRILTSLLDAYSLITMLDGIPWNNFTKAVFGIFIISLIYSIVPIWLNQNTLSVEDNIVVKEENAIKAKAMSYLTISFNMIFVDIPFLIIRAIGYYTYSISLSSFIIKNALSILGDLVEIYQLLTTGVAQEITTTVMDKSLGLLYMLR